MNWKNRITNYNFWISIFSAVLLILQALKVEFDVAYISEIATAVLGLLVVIGIISDPTKTYSKDNSFKQQQEPKDDKTIEGASTEKQENILDTNLETEVQNFEKVVPEEEKLNKPEEIKDVKENMSTPIEFKNEDGVLFSQIDLQAAIKKLSEISKLTKEIVQTELPIEIKKDETEQEAIKQELQLEGNSVEVEQHFNIVNN